MKEYLLMVKVRADKEIILNNEIIRAYPIDTKTDENIWAHPSRLIDPEDVVYDEVKAGDTYLDPLGWNWRVAACDSGRFLIHRKPKPDKWQAWKDRSPFIYAEAADWIKEGIEIGKGDDK